MTQIQEEEVDDQDVDPRECVADGLEAQSHDADELSFLERLFI